MDKFIECCLLLGEELLGKDCLTLKEEQFITELNKLVDNIIVNTKKSVQLAVSYDKESEMSE